MNIMIRDPYYLAKTVLGSYNLYILKDPFGSWHYSCVGTFKALRIITLNRCTIGERGGNIHRCQKPVKLYAEILRKNAKEGDKIFDSHLGSGSSRIAAYGLGFDFYATEIDEEYFEAQEERFHRECFGEIKTERGRLVQTNLFDK